MTRITANPSQRLSLYLLIVRTALGQVHQVPRDGYDYNELVHPIMHYRELPQWTEVYKT
jgi:hypothetical protein